MYLAGMKQKKAKMGRPSMGRDAKKIAVIVKISANERTAWAAQAKKSQMPLGPWLLKPRRDEMGKDQ